MPTLSRPRQLRAIVGLSSPLLALIGLAGCSKKVEQSEDIRPVRTLTLAPGSTEASMELSGEVVPRYESRLGFHVGGKIIARKVEVGSVVKRGQVLMQLDATDLQLSQAQAKAAVSGADSQLALARADLERYRELRAKNFVSQAVLDAKEASYKAAQSAHDQASAGLKVQANQSSYTTLVADAEGVVTALDAEVGQVVPPGSPVVRLARTGAIEVKVSIPEDRVEAIRQAKSVTVRTWAQRDNAVPGVVREIAPAADPATRTFIARVALSKATADIRLGMTATVNLSVPLPPSIRVPLTALLNDQGKTSVWVVEKGKVKLVPIEVARPQGNEILVASGLDAGQEVVIAGVHLLREGQKVSILGRPAVAAGAPQ